MVTTDVVIADVVTFDMVVARSFGPPPVLAECAAPLLKVGGWLLVSEPPSTEATDEELADELGMTTKRITRLKDAAIRPSSLDAPMGEDHDGAVGDLVRDERATTPFEEYQNKADHGMLRELMHQLPERESQILKSRFGLDGENELTLEEIGHRFGVTRERIRQLQNDAFKKLRQLMEDPELLQLAD